MTSQVETRPEQELGAAAVGGAPAQPRPAAWVAALAAGPALLIVLRLFPELDRILIASPAGHLAIAGAAALLGVGLALLVIHTATRSSDSRALLIGLGLLIMAGFFSVHAITTPSVVLHGLGAATGWSALLSLLAGALFLAASGLDLAPRTNGWIMARVRLWLAASVIIWMGSTWVMVAAAGAAGPAAHAHAQHVAQGDAGDAGAPAGWLTSAMRLDGALGLDVRGAASLLGVLCYGFATERHLRLYRRGPSQTGLAITCGCALFGLALVTQSQVVENYSISFWLYHVQEFAGFGIISVALLAGYRSGQTADGLLEGLFLSGTRARLRARYASTLEALIETIARGEQPDEAFRRDLQARFGLAESQIQALEQAAAAVAQERRQRLELERLNAALRQLQRDKEQLTQMVVHDLKNPLTAMIGFLEIMRLDAARMHESQRLLLESALRSGMNLSGLIGDVLDSARLEEGKLDLEYSIIPLPDLLRDCAGEMSAWLTQEEKIIRIDVPADLPSVIADRRLLRRVMLNLVSNAIKHTGPGTTIVLRARPGPADEAHQRQTPLGAPASSSVIIEVEDDGPGIPPEHLERIFDRFGRLSSDSHGRQQSTGLGLTFCRLAVEAHGGTITAHSQPDCGTTFRIVLPQTPPQGLSERPREQAAGGQSV